MNTARHAVLAGIQSVLASRGETVATAESCTGGLVATWLTERPGSSATYRGGVAAYHNDAKIRLLGVPAELIARHGAVSAEVAESMADQIRQRLTADFAVSITGIAGPDGGSAEKPVGTVYCAISGPAGTTWERLSLSGDRGAIREAAADAALAALFRRLDNGE